jgi:hypothetical protein
MVRVIRDRPVYHRYHDEDDDNNVYYIDSNRKHVVYEPSPPRRTMIRRPAARDYMYVDYDRSSPYDEEIVYVNNHNRPIDYIYENASKYYRRSYPRMRHATSTNIVYQ